jgi:hypothetical protein
MGVMEGAGFVRASDCVRVFKAVSAKGFDIMTIASQRKINWTVAWMVLANTQRLTGKPEHVRYGPY